MQFKRSFLLFPIIGLILFSCAQVVSPTGGERDTTPPVVIREFPENQSTLFKSNEIEITFDEYIQLNNISEELTISPPLDYQPNVRLKGKTIVIQLNDTLLENTTYSFNFGSAIKDNHEGNELPNYQYAFSTGKNIDTLKLSGLALDAFTIEPLKEVLVMLYDEPTDSTPYLKLPRYISKTNSSGEFLIRNIKEGSYLLFALEDKNRNYKFDQANELIAFKKDLVKVTGDTLGVKLFGFLEDKQPQYLKKSAIKNNTLQLILNRPADTIDIRPLTNQINRSDFFKKIYPVKDTVDFFFTRSDSSSFLVEVLVSNQPIDTIEASILPLSESDTLLESIQSFPQGNHKISKPISIVFSTPLTRIDTTKISLTIDSVITDFSVSLKEPYSKKAILSTQINEASSYQIVALPGAFIDIFGRINDTIHSNFKTTEYKDYGNLSVTINSVMEGADIPLIIQLSNSSKQLIASSIITNNETIDFNNLNSGTYTLKVIFDSNKNGKWDTGDFSKKQLPEKAALYEGEITIRSNWDKKIDWNINP